jgi:D-arabinose 1-dehydrogenase-like Zn-dependent alcohol dehydrogenase
MPIVRSILADAPGGVLYLSDRETGEPGHAQVRVTGEPFSVCHADTRPLRRLPRPHVPVPGGAVPGRVEDIGDGVASGSERRVMA